MIAMGNICWCLVHHIL